MEPLTLAASAVGLGMQLYAGQQQAEIAEKQAQVSMDIAGQEMKINQAKTRQMELEGRRTMVQNIRNAQRARAMAESSAVNQGAQFGSGLQGGLGQITAQSNWNNLGVNQALMTGREISGYNDLISRDKMQLAQLGGESAQYQGFQSLGGAVIKAGAMLGPMSQGFGGGSSYGNYSGTPGAYNTGGLY